MLAKKFLIKTFKKISIKNKIISNKLMIKSGMIKKISSGIYIYMPLGLRIINKIILIIKKYMNKNNIIEMLTPIIQPSKFWKKSNRWYKLGKELLKFKDRYNKSYTIQATSEEVVTYLIKNEINSYKELPIHFYQIQTKFRDELRPKFGLIRSREFIMKDSYSFDKNINDLKKTYKKIYFIYKKILNILKINYKIVSGNNNNIGGIKSHEFQAIIKNGDNNIIYYNNVNNIKKIKLLFFKKKKKFININIKKKKKIKIKKKNNIKEISLFLKIPLYFFIKSYILISKKNKNIYLIIIRSDHLLNKKKIKKIKKFKKFKLANKKEIFNIFKLNKIFIGPINIKKNVKIIYDFNVLNMENIICGANEKNFFFININWSKDIKEKPIIYNLVNIKIGSFFKGKKIYKIKKGIEIGHIFQLGNIYSKLINSTYINKKGKKKFFQMGCYGLGITRIFNIIIEQNYDKYGIIWKNNTISPFEIVICPINLNKNKKFKKKIKKIYFLLLKNKIDVILDNRIYNIGKMLFDWEIIGIPHLIIISNNLYKKKKIEYRFRKKKNIFYYIKKNFLLNFIKLFK